MNDPRNPDPREMPDADGSERDTLRLYTIVLNSELKQPYEKMDNEQLRIFLGAAELKGQGSSSMTAGNANTHLAVRFSTTVAVGKDDRPAFDLSSAIADREEIIGEYTKKEGNTVFIKGAGELKLTSSVAYEASMNGEGVISSAIAGQIKNSGELGKGLGHIFGGYTEGGKKIFRVWVAPDPINL